MVKLIKESVTHMKKSKYQIKINWIGIKIFFVTIFASLMLWGFIVGMSFLTYNIIKSGHM